MWGGLDHPTVTGFALSGIQMLGQRRRLSPFAFLAACSTISSPGALVLSKLRSRFPIAAVFCGFLAVSISVGKPPLLWGREEETPNMGSVYAIDLVGACRVRC